MSKNKILTDNDLMPFGVHKGKAMVDVPAVTLLWYIDNFRTWKESQLPVKEYILSNMDALKKETNGKK